MQRRDARWMRRYPMVVEESMAPGPAALKRASCIGCVHFDENGRPSSSFCKRFSCSVANAVREGGRCGPERWAYLDRLPGPPPKKKSA